MEASQTEHKGGIYSAGEVGLFINAVCENNVEEVRYFLENNVNIDCHGPNGENALCLTARGGHLELAKILLAAGCSLTIPDQSDNVWKRKAIHHAAAKGHQVNRVIVDFFALEYLGNISK